MAGREKGQALEKRGGTEIRGMHLDLVQLFVLCHLNLITQSLSNSFSDFVRRSQSLEIPGFLIFSK